MRFILLLSFLFCFSFSGHCAFTIESNVLQADGLFDDGLKMDQLSAYPIYIRVMPEDSSDILAFVELVIDGNSIIPQEEEGYYYYLWTPDQFGLHNIRIAAFHSDGSYDKEENNIEVKQGASNEMLSTFEGLVIEYGTANSRSFQDTYLFPMHLGVYDKIIAHLDISCPNDNCDDWDRLATIDVQAPDGNWVQILRYITPYGVGCSHQVDVTDYASLLEGKKAMRIFIDTWGTGGWQIDLTFEFQAGSPEFKYSALEELWDGAYDFGNPSNLQPLDTILYTYGPDVEASWLVLSNTGHGWGSNNSMNAAEFYNAKHFVDLNYGLTYIQQLWNVCDPNPDGCTGQQGSWFHPRAGWCPGAIAEPRKFAMTSKISLGSFPLTYRLDPLYIDYCHPNHPDCESGITCTDCNDGFNPVYYIDAVMVNYSNSPLLYGTITNTTEALNTDKLALQVFPNPSSGHFNLSVPDLDGSCKVVIRSVDGSAHANYYFNNAESLRSKAFNLNLDPGLYFIDLSTKHQRASASFVISN